MRNHIAYLRLDPALRAQKIGEWNKPVWWPLPVIALLLAALPSTFAYEDSMYVIEYGVRCARADTPAEPDALTHDSGTFEPGNTDVNVPDDFFVQVDGN